MAKSKGDEVIELLIEAYWMELETVLNYIANSTNLDGVRAEAIKEALALDITAELGHAQSLAKRIHELGGSVPGSLAFKAKQRTEQPPEDSTDVLSVIKGVIDGENAACQQYKKIIRLCEGDDYVTQEMCITLLASEEAHAREFIGFRKEYEKAK